MKNNGDLRDGQTYFKEYVNGLGYVNDVRPIPNSGTPPRYSVKVSALQGLSGNAHYEYHDLTIDSAQAMALLFHYQNEIKDDSKKVIAKFHFYNPRARAFEIKEGERKGEIGTTINGYLTRISYLSIDGEVIFREERNDSESQTAGEEGGKQEDSTVPGLPAAATDQDSRASSNARPARNSRSRSDRQTNAA
jgi:hypothetical protein